jgi:hypothetical protein
LAGATAVAVGALEVPAWVVTDGIEVVGAWVVAAGAQAARREISNSVTDTMKRRFIFFDIFLSLL